MSGWGRKQAINDPTGSVDVDHLPPGIPRPPQSVIDGLKRFREGMHLRYNPTAIGSRAPYKHGLMMMEWTGLYEVWDVSLGGKLYGPVYTITDGEDGFDVPGDWLVEHFHRTNPDKWGWDMEKFLKDYIYDKNYAKVAANEKEFEDNLEDMVYGMLTHYRDPKISTYIEG